MANKQIESLQIFKKRTFIIDHKIYFFYNYAQNVNLTKNVHIFNI